MTVYIVTESDAAGGIIAIFDTQEAADRCAEQMALTRKYRPYVAKWTVQS